MDGDLQGCSMTPFETLFYNELKKVFAEAKGRYRPGIGAALSTGATEGNLMVELGKVEGYRLAIEDIEDWCEEIERRLNGEEPK